MCNLVFDTQLSNNYAMHHKIFISLAYPILFMKHSSISTLHFKSTIGLVFEERDGLSHVFYGQIEVTEAKIGICKV